MPTTHELLEGLLVPAKENLTRDGRLFNVAFIAKDGLITQALPASAVPYESDDNDDVRKRKHLFAAGALAAFVDGDLVITIQEAAMIIRKTPLMDETERPLSYPKSMRTECIVIIATPLPKDRAPQEIIVETFKGGEGEPVEWLGRHVPGDGYQNPAARFIYLGWEDALQFKRGNP